MTEINRRAALKVLGILPMAGALGVSAEAQQPVVPHTMPSQPATATPQPPRNTPKRQFFTAREWRTVGVLADDIIPRDDRSGSATDAGVPLYIDTQLSLPEESEGTRVAVRGGLRWLDNESKKRFGTAYASATAAQRHQILDDISWPAKAKPEMSYGVAFFGRFRDMTASGFFSSPMGWKDLKYQGNVFNPGWDGCPPAALQKLGVTYDVMTKRG
jgi:hypothetical protein